MAPLVMEVPANSGPPKRFRCRKTKNDLSVQSFFDFARTTGRSQYLHDSGNGAQLLVIGGGRFNAVRFSEHVWHGKLWSEFRSKFPATRDDLSAPIKATLVLRKQVHSPAFLGCEPFDPITLASASPSNCRDPCTGARTGSDSSSLATMHRLISGS